ncbi:hypothetical protein EI94DRAFT_1814565 [Lactarius quietus]|nr:hypothetical protein EI94DRAFT_1814565 [Lactarius quietus]
MGTGISGVICAGMVSSGAVSKSILLEPSSLPQGFTLERAHSEQRLNPRASPHYNMTCDRVIPCIGCPPGSPLLNPKSDNPSFSQRRPPAISLPAAYNPGDRDFDQARRVRLSAKSSHPLSESVIYAEDPEEDERTDNQEQELDQCIPRGSEYGRLPMGANRKRMSGDSITPLRLLHSHWTLFPKGMISITTRVTSATAVKNYSTSNERTRATRDSSALVMMRSMRKFLIAYSPKYNTRISNISNDTERRSYVFGNRNGGLGLRTFDAARFENALQQLISPIIRLVMRSPSIS